MNEEQVITAWMSGDPAAGDLLARHYDKELRLFFRDRLPSQEIEELTQHVLLATVAQPQRFRRASSFRHYVYRVARNLLANRHREKQRKPEVPFPTNADVESPWYAPSQALARGQWDERLQAAMRELRVPFAEVLHLHMLGYDNFEIAEALHINYHTVRSRLSRAMSSLRAVLLEHRMSQTEPELAPPELPAYQAMLRRDANPERHAVMCVNAACET